MAKKHKIIIFLLIGLFIIFVITFLIMFININNKYPNPQIITYSMGSKYEKDGIETTVTGFSVEEFDYAREKIPNFNGELVDNNGNIMPDQKAKILVTNIKLKNIDNEEKRSNVKFLMIQSGPFSTAIDLELYMSLNEDFILNDSVLNPGEEIDVILPYVIYEFQFNNTNWNNIGNRKFNLVASIYPVKTILELN